MDMKQKVGTPVIVGAAAAILVFVALLGYVFFGRGAPAPPANSAVKAPSESGNRDYFYKSGAYRTGGQQGHNGYRP